MLLIYLVWEGYGIFTHSTIIIVESCIYFHMYFFLRTCTMLFNFVNISIFGVHFTMLNCYILNHVLICFHVIFKQPTIKIELCVHIGFIHYNCVVFLL